MYTVNNSVKPKVIEVAAALIWSGEKFLICRRPAHKARGLMWEFAGGKLEKGETGEEALIRECREELGVELEVYGVFADVTHEYPDITVHLTFFNSTIVKGEPKLLEHCEMAWITPDEIPQYEFCPADTKILELIKKSVHERKLDDGK